MGSRYCLKLLASIVGQIFSLDWLDLKKKKILRKPTPRMEDDLKFAVRKSQKLHMCFNHSHAIKKMLFWDKVVFPFGTSYKPRTTL